MKSKKFKELDVWKESFLLVKKVYQITDKLPDYEKYGLRSQVNRSAVSIPSNIAEGCLRGSDKEFVRFIYIALGSSAELETQLLLLKELKFFEDVNEIVEDLEKIRKMLYSLIKYLKK